MSAMSVRANTPKSPVDELIRKAPARFPDPLYEELPFPGQRN